MTVKDIAAAIENFSPRALQESYDNSGLQVGDPRMEVSAILICLDVTREVLEEAAKRECNMIVSHHPLLFHGLKQLTGSDETQRIVLDAVRNDIAIYSAHTNLDAASLGVSHEMAHMLNLDDVTVLDPRQDDALHGIGVIGNVRPTPKIEFLRRIKEIFSVRNLRYSELSRQLVIKRVALCGGSGAYLIPKAIAQKADVIITGDVKYHDFTSYGLDIVIADIGHYESELCARKILARVIHKACPEAILYFSEKEINPISTL